MTWGLTVIFISALTATNALIIRKLFCSVDENDGKLLPHQNCHQFYKCAHGAAIPFTCPENLLYSPATKQCDWPENVNCDGRPFDTSHNKVNSDPSKAPSICGQPNSDGILVAHEDCNKFYKCFNGKPVPLSCPGNLLYNPQKEQCDWPANVACKTNGSSNDNNLTHNYNVQSQIICAATNYDGLLLPHETCNQFYKCLNSRPVTQKCPSDLLFNIDVKRCDWPENVNCGQRSTRNLSADSVTESSEDENIYADPGDPNTVCANPGAVGELLPHDSCNKFYMCTTGGLVTFTCSANLLYNTVTQLCDWRENVDCGART